MPFLTLEDPNAKIKGSRDPLGIVPIWSYFGRYLVTNLTTPSNSLRGFTTLLLGRYFCERAIEEGLAETEEALNIVLRCEQLAAYAQHIGHGVDSEIRGIERVMQFAQEGKGRVYIQADKRGFILADQKVYGLWGLYSVPARRSKLINEGAVGVTSLTRDFIEKNYIPHLAQHLKPLMQILVKGGTLNLRDQPGYFRALINILGKKLTRGEHSFYGQYLRDAELVETAYPKRQKEFYGLLSKHMGRSERISRQGLNSIAKSVRSKDSVLAGYIEKILLIEALLAPAEALFNYLLMSHGRKLPERAQDLKARWGEQVPNLDYAAFEHLLPEIKNVVGEDLANTIRNCYRALQAGDYKEVLLALLTWNNLVMQQRKGSSWVRVNEAGLIDVHYRGADQSLPTRKELPHLWRNTYFIDSLTTLGRQVA